MSLNSKRGTKSPEISTVDFACCQSAPANEAARVRAGRWTQVAGCRSTNQVVVRDRAAQHEEHQQQGPDRVQGAHSEGQEQGDQHE